MAIRDRIELRHALEEIAATQAGYFTAAQALGVGYSYASQRYHVQRGNWLKVDRALFRLPRWPTTPDEHLVRWTLWSNREGVVSHETALLVHDLGNVNPARVHLTVPPRFRKHAPGVVLHRATLDPEDVRLRDGFSVTTPVRSIVDVAAAGLELGELAIAVREALERGLTTRLDLRRRADELGPTAALAVERVLAQLADRA